MHREVDIILLEQYLAGEIEAKQVLHIDGTSVSENDLKEAIEAFNDVALHVEGAALKAQLQELHGELHTIKSKSLFPRWLTVAASIAILALFATLVWQSRTSPPELSDYFTHFDQLVTFRDSDSTSYSEGLEAYSKRNYAEAYLLLNAIPELSDELNFYFGISALGSGNYKQAVLIFESIGTENSSKYYQQIKWYLSLAYWQNEQNEKAILHLSKIKEGEFKYRQSYELLNFLKD